MLLYSIIIIENFLCFPILRMLTLASQILQSSSFVCIEQNLLKKYANLFNDGVFFKALFSLVATFFFYFDHFNKYMKPDIKRNQKKNRKLRKILILIKWQQLA
jgi:hypothetical protein